MEDALSKPIDATGIKRLARQLGVPHHPSSDPFPNRSPPRDRHLEAQIFSDQPPLTPAEWEDPKKLDIRIRTLEVGIIKLSANLSNLAENCKTMRLNLDDEQELLYLQRNYTTLKEIDRWTGVMGDRVDKRMEELSSISKGYEDFVTAGRKKLEEIGERGRQPWWKAKPWYETGEVYRSDKYFRKKFKRNL
ncbi:hypothetical protein TWF730_002463 [Orbilia blumenaviensis]|uniref:Uncharacterized protein n=1 Tax=Orbilia blumenaviensis TaxID=1796055 RepID=A0AAV9UAQ7_9PEZI